MEELREICILALTFANLANLASSQTASSCANTWLTMPSMNVVGGTQVPSAVGNTTACQLACLNVPTCTGIDIDGANQCWLTSSPPVNDPTDLVTHYELKRGLNSCNGPACSNNGPAGWNETQNAHVIDGTSTADQTLTACLTTCTGNVGCSGFDWNPSNSSGNCYVITNGNPIQPLPGSGITHYQKICGVNGFQIVTPGFINPASNGGSSGLSGLTNPTTGSPQTVAPGSLTGLAIQPAYIVIIGVGGGCILLVIIAVFVLCTYPMAGKRARKAKSLFRAKPTTELHTRRPKTLTEEEINMTATTRDASPYLESNGTMGANGAGTMDRNRLIESTSQVDRNSHADRYSAVQYNGTMDRNKGNDYNSTGTLDSKGTMGYGGSNGGNNMATEYNEMAEEPPMEQDTNADEHRADDATIDEAPAENPYYEEKVNTDEDYN